MLFAFDSSCRIPLTFTLALSVLTASSRSVAQEPAADALISDQIHAAVLLRPRQFLESATFKAIVKEAEIEDLLKSGLQAVGKETGIDPGKIKEFAVLLDEDFIRQQAGTQPGHGDFELRNRLKQLGLAFHNFHDGYSEFPGHDGHESPWKGNLSWRVHLLPFLDQAALYQQFEKDEPWDSDHNKALIEEMPDFYKSPGVHEDGKTSFHVLTGEGAPFEGDHSPRIRDFTDGTSNTVLAVVAAPDSAAIWTKPGGLDVDPAEATAALGLDKNAVQVLFADGSVRPVPRDIDPQVLSHLICGADGNVIPHDLDRATTQASRLVPTIVLRAAAEVSMGKLQRTLLGSEKASTVVKERVDGKNTYTANGRTVVFLNKQTVVAGPQATVDGLLNESKPGALQDYFHQNSHAEIIFAADLSLIQQAGRQPDAWLGLMGGLFRSIRRVHGHITLADDDNNQLLEVALISETDREASPLKLMIQGLVQAGQAQMMSMVATGQLPLNEEAAQPLIDLVSKVVVAQDDNTVFLRLPHPENPEKFIASLGPALKALQGAANQARRQARASQNRNSMKQILLAFHNYHDVYNSFPNHNGGPSVDEGNHGLSWRVHLLPYLDQAALYLQFDLKEPWDSEHNKSLIAKMPELFRVEEVEQVGHTSIHVFVGDQTPFNDDTEGSAISDFTDGTSNTILTVQAGPETASPWTKPGGIEFTGEEILKSLGAIGEQFLVGLCDGSIRTIDANIDEILLLNLIRHRDGNIIGNF